MSDEDAAELQATLDRLKARANKWGMQLVQFARSSLGCSCGAMYNHRDMDE